MRGEDAPTDPWIDLQKARMGTTIAKSVGWAVGILGLGVIGGRALQLYEGKIKDLESRQSDMPTKADLGAQRAEFEARMRYMLEQATWWCPPIIRSKPSAWVECKASFQTYPAPPKER